MLYIIFLISQIVWAVFHAYCIVPDSPSEKKDLEPFIRLIVSWIINFTLSWQRNYNFWTILYVVLGLGMIAVPALSPARAKIINIAVVLWLSLVAASSLGLILVAFLVAP